MTRSLSLSSYMFPKHLLSPHFWSMQQRYQFSTDMLQDRLRYQRHVFRFLQSKLDSLRDDREKFERMRHVLGRLGSGQHPTVAEIQGLQQIITDSEYSFQSLPHYHLVSKGIIFCEMYFAFEKLFRTRNNVVKSTYFEYIIP